MKRKYKSLALLAVVMMVIGMIGYSLGALENTLGKEDSEIVIVDATGETIEFDSPPERIITYGAASTEIVFHLEEGDRVIATDDFSNHPPEVQDLPKVGGAIEPNYEKIIDLEPDAVVTRAANQNIIEDLRGYNETVVGTHGDTLEDVYEDIELLGTMIGMEEAEEKADELQETMDDLTEETRDLPEEDRNDVLYLTGIDPIYVPGEGTFQHTLIQRAGGNNIAGEKTGWEPMEEETIIAEDPQVIVAPDHLSEDVNETIDDDPWQGISAVQDDNVYFVDGDEFSRAGPRLVDAQSEMVDILEDVDENGDVDDLPIPFLNPLVVLTVIVISVLIYKKTKHGEIGRS